MERVVINRQNNAKLPLVIDYEVDPTGSVLEFAATQEVDNPTVWVAGEWAGAWSATTGRVDAKTPRAGEGRDLDVAPGDYDIWARWTVGGDTPVVRVGKLRVL